MLRTLSIILILLVCLVPRATAVAQTQPATTQSSGAPTVGADGVAVTEHEVVIEGKPLRYRARAGYLPLADENGKERARFFFMAYEQVTDAGQQAAHQRPLTFVFNGGPGAASVWLHMGALGPQRVQLEENGQPPAPPHRYIPNEFSWLDVTDLVFIDPVGTGFSRPAPGEKGDAFYGVKEDVASVGEFIRLYLTRYERWLSPKFVAGESYGTTRAAKLSDHLHERYGIDLNGILMISTVLDFQTLRAQPDNDLAYVLFLPTYTATAWHHNRLTADLQADLQKTLRDVESWSIREYLPALARGAALPDAQHQAVALQLARYTGLPLETVLKSDLRISPERFQNQLLAGQRLIVGRMDTRLTAFNVDPLSGGTEFDPSLSRYLGAYSTAFNAYVRQDLTFQSDLTYEVLSDRVWPWDFGDHGSGYLNVTDDLRSAMQKIPAMKVLFASGYFDLATPYFATDYTIHQMRLSPELRKNITQTHYLGGHMMYHPLEGLKKLKQDAAAFIRGAVAPNVQ